MRHILTDLTHRIQPSGVPTRRIRGPKLQRYSAYQCRTRHNHSLWKNSPTEPRRITPRVQEVFAPNPRQSPRYDERRSEFEGGFCNWVSHTHRGTPAREKSLVPPHLARALHPAPRPARRRSSLRTLGAFLASHAAHRHARTHPRPRRDLARAILARFLLRASAQC